MIRCPAVDLRVGGGGWVRSFVGVSWNGLCDGWWAVGALLGPERTGRRRIPWLGVCSCVGCLVGLACCSYRFGAGGPLLGLVVFVVGGVVCWCLFVV